MAQTESKKSVNIVNDAGAVNMEMSKIDRDGGRLVIEGRLMGAWPSKMYVGPQDVRTMVGLVLKPAIIGYIFSLPVLLLLLRKNMKKQQ